MTLRKVFFLACLSACLFLCSASYSEGAQQSDYREKTQSLSKEIHGTLAELKEQSAFLQEQLSEAKSDLRLYQGLVRELQMQVTDLSTSLANTNKKLSGYSEKLTVLKHSLKRWRTIAVVETLLILAYIVLKVLKIVKKIQIPFI